MNQMLRTGLFSLIAPPSLAPLMRARLGACRGVNCGPTISMITVLAPIVPSLILKHANLRPASRMALTLAFAKRYFGFGDKDDHVVLDGARVIGRIFLSPQSPPDRNWMWTITAPEHPRSIHTRGYSATREEAMVDFKAQWFN